MNKVLVAVMTAAVLASSALADSIIMRDGRTVPNVKVLKIGAEEIEYKVGERETLYSAKKTEVERITYDDGTQDVFAAAAPPPPPPPPAPAPVAPAPVAETAPAASNNAGESNIRFGIKGALMFSSMTNDELNVGGTGYGFSFGGVALIPFSNAMGLNLGVHGFYRKAFTLEIRSFDTDLSASDAGVSVPFSLVVTPNVDPIRNLAINLGVQLDVPFSSNASEQVFGGPLQSTSIYSSFRASLDFGLSFGIGYRINEHFLADFGVILNLTDYDSIDVNTLDVLWHVSSFRQFVFSITYFM